MKNINIETMIQFIDFLALNALEYDSYSKDSITILMDDVNKDIDGVPWEKYIQSLFDNINISFSYGNFDYVTIQF